ncbi:hypothetical protein [Amycolatopsis cihanbeyliensis]|uniref:Excreted virulence factor EspC (Type VII ESX diderm) n=1 Tax=Amycolatopsis cihanbeyliensis TaxID=1128664 RepID=A0A542DRN9_AMYCI|nr:hypothetical protein [Amycolatopsis cihanbeyliensis]TQJ05781.1 hypothetical protein FB471_5621 [Amycolatopsis cihanbeyliensis]
MAEGDAGNSFLQSIIAGADSEAQAKAFADDAKGMLGEAKAGRWAVSEEMGQAFLAAVDEAEQQVSGLHHRVRNLARKPMLGDDEYARQVSQHVLMALDSDERSLVPAFNSFKDGLGHAREALEIARRNYKAADEDANQKLGPFLTATDS